MNEPFELPPLPRSDVVARGRFGAVWNVRSMDAYARAAVRMWLERAAEKCVDVGEDRANDDVRHIVGPTTRQWREPCFECAAEIRALVPKGTEHDPA